MNKLSALYQKVHSSRINKTSFVIYKSANKKSRKQMRGTPFLMSRIWGTSQNSAFLSFINTFLILFKCWISFICFEQHVFCK